MTTNDQLVQQMISRGVTAHDLEDTVLALIHDQNAALMESMAGAGALAIMQSMHTEARTLTNDGLLAQVDWMDRYYNNRENLQWALAGYLNLPLAA